MRKFNFILLLIFAGQVFASPAERGKNPLGLDEAQQAQMQAVKQKQHERMQAAREEIMADSKAEMATFLTTEQMEKLESMHEHRKEHAQMRKHKSHKKHRKNKRNKE